MRVKTIRRRFADEVQSIHVIITPHRLTDKTVCWTRTVEVQRRKKTVQVFRLPEADSFAGLAARLKGDLLLARECHHSS